MLIKFPQYIEKNLSEIIKIDKLHEKGLIIKNFSNYLQIFLPKKINDQKSFIIRRFINIKTLQVYKKTGCRWQHLIIAGSVDLTLIKHQVMMLKHTPPFPRIHSALPSIQIKEKKK